MTKGTLGKAVCTAILFLSTAWSGNAEAAIPDFISYQGYLTASNGVPVDGTVNLTFRIYDVDAGGEALWSEPRSVNVSSGVYSVRLGAVTPLAVLQFDVPYWLGVEVETDGEMTPRRPFASTPFAVKAARSEVADSVAPGSITDSSITGPISAGKIDPSGLNADLLDNMDSAEFAAASHSHGSSDIVAPLSLTTDIGGATVHAVNTAPASGTGLQGEGDFMGVAGFTQHDSGVGVYGQAGTAGASYGVYGYSQSPTGYGVYGKNTDGGYAGYFEGDVEVTGALSGNASGLTNLNASDISAGTLGDSRLSANVGLLDADQPVTGVKHFAPAAGTVPFTVDPSRAGQVAYLNADLLDGQHTSEIIAAAADEVRAPVSSCGTTISASGSYYVTQNLSTSGTCITVTADDVTVDLMGFTLTGGSVAQEKGVMIQANNVAVENGTIEFFHFGIRTDLNFVATSVENVRIHGGSFGMLLQGSNHTVKDCYVYENVFSGIGVDGQAVITGNKVFQNGAEGISGGSDSIIENNVVQDNGTGIACGSSCGIKNNIITRSGDAGVTIYGAGRGSIISNNIIRSSQTDGSTTNQPGAGFVITDNVITYNQNYGISVATESASLIDGNTVVNNNQSGGAYTNISTCTTCTFGTNHAP